jgi:hypothetical protein
MISYIVPPAVRALIDNKFDVKAQRSTLRQFFSVYTMHDSYFLELSLDSKGSCYLLLQWDPVWVENDTFKGIELTHWPYLYIEFGAIHQIVADGLEQTASMPVGIGSGNTTRVSYEQRVLWIDFLSKLDLNSKRRNEFLLDQELFHTTLELEGAELSIYHSEPTYFLCSTEEGVLVNILELDQADTE